jgi:hypothetical protein
MTKGRRSRISYVEDDWDHSIIFFKRRSGLYKTAADLSTLTSTRIAIALESESGKMSSFGTPSAGPIIDYFISGKAPVDDEEQHAGVTLLQNKVFMAEIKKFMQDKRTKDTTARAKDIQDALGKSKLSYGKIEDLSVDELVHYLID